MFLVRCFFGTFRNKAGPIDFAVSFLNLQKKLVFSLDGKKKLALIEKRSALSGPSLSAKIIQTRTYPRGIEAHFLSFVLWFIPDN